MHVLLPLGLMTGVGLLRAKAAPAAPAAHSPTSGIVAPDPQPGALSLAEWSRLCAVEIRLEQTQTISDGDIGFVAHLLRSRPPLDTPDNAFTREQLTLSQLCASKPVLLTPVQRKRLFDAVLPFTGSTNSVVQGNAMLVLARTRDPRVVPVMKRLMNSPRPFTNSFAGSLLHSFKAAPASTDGKRQ